MPPRGIEPRSMAAYLVSVVELESTTHGPKPRVSPSTPHRDKIGVLWGIEPSQTDSQSAMQPLHQQHHRLGRGTWDRTKNDRIKICCDTISLCPNCMVDRVGIEPTDNCLQSSQEPQLNHSPIILTLLN